MTSPNYRPNDTAWRVMHDMNKRLTAIEERLTKLEKQWIDGMEGTVDTKPTKQPQSPKVCPVSGMFLEEPDYEEFFNVENGVAGSEGRYRPSSRGNFVTGNCFATRDDAERYAKHLKAMAKLRRLGGVRWHARQGDVIMTCLNENHSQLTPEEQNALMWPNEEK